jgi:hypothetical protein
MGISVLFSVFIPLGYFLGNCRQHPSQIMVMICLLEMVASYNLLLIASNIFAVENVVHLENLLKWMSMGLVDLDAQGGLLFCEINLTLYFLVETLNLAYNICLSVDLVVTLARPFISGKLRNVYYHSCAVAVTLLLALCSSYEPASICVRQN